MDLPLLRIITFELAASRRHGRYPLDGNNSGGAVETALPRERNRSHRSRNIPSSPPSGLDNAKERPVDTARQTAGFVRYRR
jgi:hypothetical protein